MQSIIPWSKFSDLSQWITYFLSLRSTMISFVVALKSVSTLLSIDLDLDDASVYIKVSFVNGWPLFVFDLVSEVKAITTDMRLRRKDWGSLIPRNKIYLFDPTRLPNRPISSSVKIKMILEQETDKSWDTLSCFHPWRLHHRNHLNYCRWFTNKDRLILSRRVRKNIVVVQFEIIHESNFDSTNKIIE